jgi:SAM-dependent methyltransferase
VEKAEFNKNHFLKENPRNVHYVQGDVQNPPFADGTFDVIYCDGVLHHTPNTRVSFASLAPLTKVGGKMFIWVYRRDLSLFYRVKTVAVEIIRKLLRPFPLKIVRTLCFCGAVILLGQLRIRHLLGFKTRRIIPVWLKTINLFDTFTPRYNHLHTRDEVKSWFAEEGFLHPVETTIPKLGHEGFGILGTRGVTETIMEIEKGKH